MNFLVTGGAGFIGSAVCRHICSDLSNNVTNVDKLTYAGNLASLRSIENQHNYRFVVETICDILDRKKPRSKGRRYRDLITFVTDRPGHDRRYAIDASKIERELGWVPQENFESGLSRTIDWYLANDWWWGPIRAEKYAGQRLGEARKAAE